MTVIRPNSIAGINSITVQSGQALNVHDASGNLIRSLTNSSGITTYQSVTVTSGDLIVGTSDLFVDNSTGHIGMGTEVPTDTGGYGRALDIKGGASGAAIYLRTLNGDTGQIALGSADLTIRTRQADPIIFNTNNSEKLRITSDGKIGIGTDNPASLLNLSGSQPRITFNDTSGTDDTAKIFSSSGALYLQQRDGSAHGEIIFRTENNSTAVERLRIDNSGRLGIQGAASRALLEVRASGGSNTMLTALWGANEGTTDGTLSDNTDKACRMGIQHYDTDALPYGLLVGSSSNGVNNLTFGGGTSLMNAATEIKFNTAANSTTTSGSERFRIASAGQLGIGGANYGTSGQVLTSGGASAAPSWAAAGGITMAEHWRLTSSSQGNADPLTAWEAADNGFAGNLGSSMTVSSGVFTFPATGMYYVMFTLVGYSDSSTQNLIGGIKYTGNDGGSWQDVAYGLNGIYDYSNSYPSWSTNTCHYIFDIFDLSDQKIRFLYGAGQGPEYVKGDSNISYTSATFIRLGDT